jgi:hypothetical protein
VQKSVSERTLDVCRIRHWQEAIDPEAGLPGKGFGFSPHATLSGALKRSVTR